MEFEDKRLFMRSLQDFWSQKGLHNMKIPQIGGKELDLLHLYKSVTKRGGAQVVSANKLWREVVNEFGLPSSCTSASFTLRNHYQRYLLQYEQKYYFGRDDINAQTQLSSSRIRKQIKYDSPQGSIIMPQTQYGQAPSGTYQENPQLQTEVTNQEQDKNQKQQKIEEQQMDIRTTQQNLRNALLNKYGGTELENQLIYYIKKNKTIPLLPEMTRIILAFESGMPEELTFALNSLLLYSCNYTYPLLFDQYPALLKSITAYLEKLSAETPFLHKYQKLQTFPPSESLFISFGLLDLTNSGVSKLPLLQYQQKSGIPQPNIMSSELQNMSSLRTILHILRNFSSTQPNDISIVRISKLFTFILELLIKFQYDQDLYLSLLELTANISVHINLQTLPTFLPPQTLIETILTWLNKPQCPNSIIYHSLQCLSKLSLVNENESLLEAHLINNLNILCIFLIHQSTDIRELCLEVFCFLSDLKMQTRIQIAKFPRIVLRLVALLSYQPSNQHSSFKAAKLAAMVLSNLSLAPANSMILLPFQRELFMIAATDETGIGGIVANILGQQKVNEIDFNAPIN